MPKIYSRRTLALERKGASVAAFDWATSVDIAAEAGLENLGCNLRSLARGEYSYPYHFHHNAEEVFVVLSGSGRLRTPEGFRDVAAGDIAIFEKGASGAHQLFNGNEEPLVYLDFRTMEELDLCEYPDTGKVNILPQREIFYKGEHAGYFEGEEAVEEVWRRADEGRAPTEGGE